MATLYVNSATGDDSRSYATAQNSSTPWLTIARAAWGSTSYASPNTSQAAQAGDVVLIAAGIYTENGNPSGNRFTVALNPANSGTSGNLITFRGVGTVEIRMANTYRGGTIGADGRNYIVWDHIYIDDYYQGSTDDTGPIVFHSTTGSQLINSEALGHPGSYFHGYSTFGGNYRLVSLEPSDGVIIRNNRLHRVHLHATGAGGQNEGAILSYDAHRSIIEHNEIYDAGAAVFIKGQHEATLPNGNIIRYNYIHDNDSDGVRVIYGADTLIYQNIITNSGAGLHIGFNTATRTRAINNTLYGNTNGVHPQNSQLVDVHVKNNIVVGTGNAVYDWESANPGTQDMEFDRNLYDDHATFARYDNLGSISFATWQGTYGQDANSLNNTDPLFVAAGTNFKLRVGSPALTLGRVVESIGGTNGATIPAGAYITGNETIGVATGDTTPPSAPTGVRVA